MTDQKRLRGEQEHKITQHEIDAWNRGKKDAKSQERLKVKADVDSSIRIVKLYSTLGDVHTVALKLDVDVQMVRSVLTKLNINSIEDAVKILTSGVLASYEKELKAEQEDNELEKRNNDETAKERFEEHKRVHQQEIAKVDESRLLARQKEAQQKNKKDQLRKVINDGLKTKTSGFKIPIDRVAEFKRAIASGVNLLQRTFGGSKQDIVNEIQRLAPGVDIDTLRP